jgi:glycosyltransferase involved in cell wall biosynthesis
MRKLIQLNSTDWIACGTAAGEWLYGKTFFHRKGSVILNGIDVNAFKFRESKRNEIRNRYMLENKFVVGHVGHFSTVKNQVFLLDLMKTMVATRPETVLIMLGEGDQRQLIEDKIKECKLEKNVILTGNVMNVADYLSAMDVFAFPSLYEGMPLSIIEVQANGLPAIVSDRVPEDVFLTDLITIVSLENREGWFESIYRVSRNHPEEYSDFLLERGYDSATMVRKIYSIYEKSFVYN